MQHSCGRPSRTMDISHSDDSPETKTRHVSSTTPETLHAYQQRISAAPIAENCCQPCPQRDPCTAPPDCWLDNWELFGFRRSRGARNPFVGSIEGQAYAQKGVIAAVSS
ncbi:hypothetical protein PG993_010985 [Apiospora rasikravindrae]|uniref:Uncharacterized protein n=1 Tax=Apiospora rasikravindrae TaxID=990691 RepID=A0ABR1SCY3_9PEZI